MRQLLRVAVVSAGFLGAAALPGAGSGQGLRVQVPTADAASRKAEYTSTLLSGFRVISQHTARVAL